MGASAPPQAALAAKTRTRRVVEMRSLLRSGNDNTNVGAGLNEANSDTATHLAAPLLRPASVTSWNTVEATSDAAAFHLPSSGERLAGLNVRHDWSGRGCHPLARWQPARSARDAALHLGVTSRQGSYYLAAVQRLERDYRTRQLFLAAQLFQHQIFLKEMLTTDALPTQDRIIEHMTALNVCKPGKTMQHRSQTVLAWLTHLHDLYNA